MIQRPRVQEARNSLIQGNDSAAGKDQHGHYKGPEVEFLAVTERMRVIGRLSSSMKTVQQQGAVSRVDNRVDAFRKHRGASTEKRGGKFRGSDDQIGAHGHENRYWFLVHSAKGYRDELHEACLPRKNSVLR